MNTLVCPNCNQTNEWNAAVCLRCGRTLVNAYAVRGYRQAPPQPVNYCRICGFTYGPRQTCPRCNGLTGTIANPNDATCTTYLHVGYPYPTPSANDAESVINALDPTVGWNWGAAVFTVFWAVPHRIFWTIGAFFAVALLPALLIIGGAGERDPGSYFATAGWMFGVCYALLGVSLGMRGNSMAWRRRKFDSVEQFRAVQRKWSRAALVVLVLFAAALLALSQLK